MISSEESDSFRIFNFKAEEKLESFHWVVTSINKIPNENVASLIDLTTLDKVKSTCSEEFEQIVELTVNITAYCDRCRHRLHIRFLQENFFGFFANQP